MQDGGFVAIVNGDPYEPLDPGLEIVALSSNNNISSHRAGNFGGAWYAKGHVNLTLDITRLHNNSADQWGGAAYCITPPDIRSLLKAPHLEGNSAVAMVCAPSALWCCMLECALTKIVV